MHYKCNQYDNYFSDSSVKCFHTYKDSYMVIQIKRDSNQMQSMSQDILKKKGNLIISHMKSHTYKRPDQCSQCGETLSQNSNLTIHMINRFGIVNRNF